MRDPDASITMTEPPRILAQPGNSHGNVFVWSSVGGASRYGITVFNLEGTVVWETETSDTIVGLPATLARTRGDYLWKVEAHTSWNRSVESELARFSIREEQ